MKRFGAQTPFGSSDLVTESWCKISFQADPKLIKNLSSKLPCFVFSAWFSRSTKAFLEFMEYCSHIHYISNLPF